MISTLHDKAEGTREMYEEKGRRILTSLGDPFVHDISRDTLSAYITLRLSKDPDHGNASPHTVQKELITMRRALREAHERGVLKVMPPFPRHSPKYKPRETWLTPQQFEAVSNELDPKRRLWAALAALAGGSAGEVERIEWKKTNLETKQMYIPGTKRETRARWVPIPPALLHRLLEVPPSERHGRVARPWSNVRRDLRRAVDAANAYALQRTKEYGQPAPEPIPYVSPNDLRRTFASWLVQHGVPLLHVATLMGHSSTRMVEKVYGKLSKEVLAQAVVALPQLWAGATVTTVSPDMAYSSLLEPTDVHGSDDRGLGAVLVEKPEENQSCPGSELNQRHADFQSASTRSETVQRSDIATGAAGPESRERERHEGVPSDPQRRKATP